MRKIATITALMFLLISCHKESNLPLTTPENKVFFTSQTSLYAATQKAIDLFTYGQELVAIDSVHYHDGPDKTGAIVYYRTMSDTTDLAFENTYDEHGRLTGTVAVKCTGSCNADHCKVVSSLDSKGNSVYSCTCSSCTMEIKNVSLEDIE
jgi:hypothetical protein